MGKSIKIMKSPSGRLIQAGINRPDGLLWGVFKHVVEFEIASLRKVIARGGQSPIRSEVVVIRRGCQDIVDGSIQMLKFRTTTISKVNSVLVEIGRQFF